VADKYDAPPYRWALRVAQPYWWALRVAWGGFALLLVCKLRAIDVYSSQSIQDEPQASTMYSCWYYRLASHQYSPFRPFVFPGGSSSLAIVSEAEYLNAQQEGSGVNTAPLWSSSPLDRQAQSIHLEIFVPEAFLGQPARRCATVMIKPTQFT
jgi:hypothetical protein